MRYYPLFMDLAGRPCLVVGAGAVAARKARSLLDCGARVTVVGVRPRGGVPRARAPGGGAARPALSRERRRPPGAGHRRHRRPRRERRGFRGGPAQGDSRERGRRPRELHLHRAGGRDARRSDGGDLDGGEEPCRRATGEGADRGAARRRIRRPRAPARRAPGEDEGDGGGAAGRAPAPGSGCSTTGCWNPCAAATARAAAASTVRRCLDEASSRSPTGRDRAARKPTRLHGGNACPKARSTSSAPGPATRGC